jgi:hypothetical protein
MTNNSTLPTDSLRHAVPYLRAPFAPDAVSFMVQAQWSKGPRPSGGLVVPYLDVTTVEDRLDTVIGPERWAVSFQALDPTTLLATLELFGVSKEAVGQGRDRWAQEANAFKRAARKFEVGRYLYKMHTLSLKVGSGADQLRVKDGRCLVDERLAARLREGYRRRLEATYVALYGPALDHHDLPDQLGDVEAAGRVVGEPEPANRDQQPPAGETTVTFLPTDGHSDESAAAGAQSDDDGQAAADNGRRQAPTTG